MQITLPNQNQASQIQTMQHSLNALLAELVMIEQEIIKLEEENLNNNRGDDFRHACREMDCI